MQASLPKLVRMVSVEDIGQGSESIQILGVKWLPTGAAARSVTEDGDLKKEDDAHPNDQKSGSDSDNDKGNENDDNENENDETQQEDGSQQPISQGLEGEEGDFVNMEVAFAYRARSATKSIQERSKDAHLYLAFFLPGGIKVPVWVELRGVVGSMRMRLRKFTPECRAYTSRSASLTWLDIRTLPRPAFLLPVHAYHAWPAQSRYFLRAAKQVCHESYGRNDSVPRSETKD